MPLRALLDFPRVAYEFVATRTVLSVSVAFMVFFLAFAWAYLPLASVAVPDDHFFHIRIAHEMQEQGILGAFHNLEALPYSWTSGDEKYFPYYNFLFYLALIPFTYATPLILGSKLYSVFAAAAFFTAIYAVLRALAVRHPAVLTAVLFVLMHTDALWRLFASRPFVLAPSVLVLLLVALYKRSVFWSFSLSFLYLFWYSATFFMPALVAVSYAVIQKAYAGTAWLRAPLAACAGVVAAVAAVSFMAPGFFLFLKDVVFVSALKVGDVALLMQGVELYPADPFAFAKANTLLLGAAFLALAVETLYYLRVRVRSLAPDALAPVRVTLLLLSLAFFAASVLMTNRFSDYLFAFFGVYAALGFDRLRREVAIPDAGVRRAMVAGLMLCLAYFGLTQLVSIRSHLGANGTPPELFMGVGEWLSENAPQGSVVFNPTWNWFPQLYYYAPTMAYVNGIEPRLLYAYDERKYWLWFYASNYGYRCEDPECPEKKAEFNAVMEDKDGREAFVRKHAAEFAGVIADDFKASFIISSPEFVVLNDMLADNPRFKLVYGEGTPYQLYEVLPERKR